MIRLDRISKTYLLAGQAVPVLRDICLHIRQGELVALTGPSGSGKSTLMNILGCLDTPSQGRYFLADNDVAGHSRALLAYERNRRIGFVFQNFNLMPRMNAWENVAHPLIYRGIPPTKRRELACEALHRVGLQHRLAHYPSQLSGGQKQRVAIARALVGKPQLVLADEPTGNLDSETAGEVMQLLTELHNDGMTLIVVTHEPTIGDRCERIVRIQDGRIVEDRPRDRVTTEAAH